MRDFGRIAQTALALVMIAVGITFPSACMQSEPDGPGQPYHVKPSTYVDVGMENEQECYELRERKRRWTHDINQFREHLSRHPKFTDVSVMDLPANIEIGRAIGESISVLLGEVPYLSDFEMKVGLQHALAILRDNHTRVVGFVTPELYPLHFRWLADGFYLIQSHERYAAGLNHRLDAINGVPLERIFHRFKHFEGAENIYDTRAAFATTINSPMIIDALGLSGERKTVFTFVDGYGGRLDVIPSGTYSRDVERLDRSLVFESVELVNAHMEGELPLFLRNQDKMHWHAFLEDSGILYMRFNGYGPDIDLETGQMYAFENDVRAVFDEADVEAVVIDARDNIGGSHMHQHLFRFLAENAPLGKFFHFINESSYSAALDAAAHLSRLGATIVGQPSGQGLEFYAFRDIGHDWSGAFFTTLQYSGFDVFVANMVFSIRERHGIESDDNVFRPHVLIEHTIDDWVNNRDPLLEYVLELLGRD
ncbi:MAG: hypothetical protein FWB97_06435 [Oscillospiraceae bacterium]|nr:hypothetical protein [Oscillospiraceae bacterium]